MVARGNHGTPIRMVSDQRLQPTFTADLAAAILAAVEAEASGVVHLTASGACSWFEFTEAILDLAGVRSRLEPTLTTVPPGGADRPLNGVLARRRSDQLGLPVLRHWRDSLSRYMSQAGLVATAAKGA
jgi:dTDP-4-dehydrorhamnose reductase